MAPAADSSPMMSPNSADSNEDGSDSSPMMSPDSADSNGDGSDLTPEAAAPPNAVPVLPLGRKLKSLI